MKKLKNIEKIILTASGGPFLNKQKKINKYKTKICFKTSKLENGKKNFNRFINNDE